MKKVVRALGLILVASWASAQPAFESFTAEYCITCHDDSLRTAGVSLSGKVTSGELLEKVLRKLRSGDMPPPGMPSPSAADRRAMVDALEQRLDAQALSHQQPGTPLLHRLNRAEYQNALRDLLGLTVDLSDGLPPDDSSYGFDNIAASLNVSPAHLEKYLAVARRASRTAVGTLKPSLSTEKITPLRGTANDPVEGMPPEEHGGLSARRFFPFNAEYGITIRVRGNPSPGAPPSYLDLRIDGSPAKFFDVNISIEEALQDSRIYEWRGRLPAGDHTIATALWSVGLAVDWLTLGGPYKVEGPGATPSRKRIFVCRPRPGEAEEPCARRILSSLAHRAYRRPVTEADLAPLLSLFAQGRLDGKTFDSGIENALTGLLVSPDFLYRREQAPPNASAPYQISELDLASRLSFFLWSSLPDDQLLSLAESHQLRKPGVLESQVRRMLQDPKSAALYQNFAGQWLHLRNVASWNPDPGKFPRFDDSLRAAFSRESELFFTNLIREDRSVLEFLDSSYTYLNDRLARYYGVPGVKGPEFRRVELHGEHRGGVLGQGAILMVTSYPTRTSPVLRGKWILENLLGDPPPPPPPNVPPLDDSAAASAHTLREQLERHRANAACAACHAKLDPLGFSLEQYDAVGRFRLKEGNAWIDAEGSLSDGTMLDGPEGLKRALLARKDEFVECLASKLLTYALGRGLEFYDQPAVREIRRKTAAADYRFSAMILAIADSVPFERKGPGK